MECVEAVALKSSRKEMMVVVKQSPPQLNFLDEFNCMQNGAVSSDDFFVDELLDFSNEDGFGGGGFAGQDGEEDHVEEQEEEVKTPRAASASASVSPNHEITLEDQNNNHHRVTTNSVGKDDFVMIPATELCVPADDVASLEWLSHFVEDSNSEYSTPFPVGALPAGMKKEDRSEPGKQVLATEPCFKTPVPGKARSKRTRTGVRVWPLLGSPSLTESSSSPTTSSSSSSCPSSPWLIYTNTGPNVEPVDPEKPVFKKQKKTQVGVEVGHGGGTQTPRRCSHCGVQKTPQWRTGPLGAKTLCNACGVRYKSGRLLPEYRPACSPTFSSELHSNHHRKVLEMRKKKEPVFGQPEPGLGQGAAVPSFG